MADEPVQNAPTPIGTPALRRTVSVARATAATSMPAPALPPDQSSSPWAGFVGHPPTPDNMTTPAAVAERRAREDLMPPVMSASMTPPPKSVKRGAILGKVNDLQLRKAWALVERLLEKWSEESTQNVGKANVALSRRLAKNGVVLLREGIPMGSVSDLIRLCNELARVQQGDGEEEDERITQIQASLKREIRDLTAENDTDPDEGEDDGA